MTSEEPDTSRGTRRRPAWAIGSIAAAVLLAGGGGAYWASTAHGEGSGGGRAADSAASAPRSAGDPSGPGIAPGEPDPSGGGVVYRAEVKLPEAPATAPTFTASGEVSAQEVARLAAALGVPGDPRLTGDVWLAGEAADGSGPRLTVSRKAPGTWNYTRFQAGNGNGTGDDCVRGKDTCGPATLPQGADKGSRHGQPARTRARPPRCPRRPPRPPRPRSWRRPGWTGPGWTPA